MVRETGDGSKLEQEPENVQMVWADSTLEIHVEVAMHLAATLKAMMAAVERRAAIPEKAYGAALRHLLLAQTCPP